MVVELFSSVLNRMITREQPPTHHKLNKLTQGFSEFSRCLWCCNLPGNQSNAICLDYLSILIRSDVW